MVIKAYMVIAKVIAGRGSELYALEKNQVCCHIEI